MTAAAIEAPPDLRARWRRLRLPLLVGAVLVLSALVLAVFSGSTPRQPLDPRDPAKSGIYAYEQSEGAKLGDEMEAQVRANAAAWRFFEAQPPGYRKIAVRYVRSAKLEATQARRLATLIAESAAGRRIGMEPPPRPGRR